MLANSFHLSEDPNPQILHPERRKKLFEIEDKVKSLLELADFTPVKVALAVYAANYLKQEPLWLMMVAPPSSGKTAILASLYHLPHVQVPSDLTKSALLSGTASKERSESSTGGLLKKLGKIGFLVIKDFTSVLSMNPDARAELLAALREIYDGDYSRFFGSDGGTHSEWHGRIGLIAAVTPEIERHRRVITSMGDRFLLLRVINRELRMEQGFKALRASGNEKKLTSEMQELAEELFSDFVPETEIPNEELIFMHKYIVPLAAFVADWRTPVMRSRTRDIVQIPSPEGPARLAKQFYGLFCGLLSIGCSLKEAWEITVRVGLDTLPESHYRVFKVFLDHQREKAEDQISLSEMMKFLQLPKTTTNRILEELHVIKVLSKENQFYRLSDETEELASSFFQIPENRYSVPEISEDPMCSDSQGIFREQLDSLSYNEGSNDEAA